jgi:hypothetical protein
MDIAETVKAIQPLQGEVVPIRTVQETQPVEEFGMTLHGVDPRWQHHELICLQAMPSSQKLISKVQPK